MSEYYPICLIAAVAKNGVIGKNNKMPWHLAEDLKHFKKLTIDNPIIMGRKTFASFANHLVRRFHLVISQQKKIDINGYASDQSKNIISPANEIIGSLVENQNQAIEYAKKWIIEKTFLTKNQNSIYVIGGAQIYQLFLSIVDKLYITEIDQEYIGDTYFPFWNNLSEKFTKISSTKHISVNELKYSFTEYQKNTKSIK